MKNYKFFCFLLLCILLFSCRRHYTNDETILRAEGILYSKPDSAQKLLLSIPHPYKLPKADYAAWCLLYTHSQYKLYQDIKSDSLIRIALNYYEDSNLTKQSGTAYYLLGCILQSESKNKEAMLAYKKAANLLDKTNEDDLKGLVSFEIGGLYMQDELFNQSLEYFRKSSRHFLQTNNLKYQAYTYRAISNVYIQTHYSFDSIMYYSNKALKLAKQSVDTTNYYSILAQQGELLYNRDFVRSKDYLLKGYHYFPTLRSYYASYLSFVFSKLNEPDSAEYYLRVSSSGKLSLESKLTVNIARAYLAKNKGNGDKAYNYVISAYNIRDSIFQHNIHSQIHRIDKQYDLTQKEKENAELKISRRNNIIVIALLMIGLLILLIIALLANSRSKRKQAEHAIEKQRMEYEIETKQAENIQKQQLLMTKLQNKIENTLRFNHLKIGLLQQDKHDAFVEEITKQAVISEKEWQYYIDEIDQLFDGRIALLSEKYTELTRADLIVISLIGLQKDITDCCSLLNMTQNTMYVRRKRIKKRIGLDADIDLEEWIMEYIQHKTIEKTSE